MCRSWSLEVSSSGPRANDRAPGSRRGLAEPSASSVRLGVIGAPSGGPRARACVQATSRRIRVPQPHPCYGQPICLAHARSGRPICSPQLPPAPAYSQAVSSTWSFSMVTLLPRCLRRCHAGCLRLPRGPRAGGRPAAITASTHAVSLAWGAWVGAPASTRDTWPASRLGCIIRALHPRQQGLLPTPSHRSPHTTRLHNVVCVPQPASAKQKGPRPSHPRQLPRPEGSAGATQRWCWQPCAARAGRVGRVALAPLPPQPPTRPPHLAG